jgi:hypothetical protein
LLKQRTRKEARNGNQFRIVESKYVCSWLPDGLAFHGTNTTVSKDYGIVGEGLFRYLFLPCLDHI